MKLLYSIIFLLIISQISYGQDFSFQMYFEDAAGNKDTLTMGYDINGTDTIDSGLNESNIISSPLDTVFDVRISDAWDPNGINPTFHTKRQIIENKCGSWFSIIEIDFRCKNWPVTATWNSTQFTDSCKSGSVMTSCVPGGWFDVCGGSSLHRANLAFYNQVTFSGNDGMTYINNSNDTIHPFWLTFADSTMISSSINEFENSIELTVYPNPSSDFLQIKVKKQSIKIKNVQLFDISGKEQQLLWKNETIDIRSLSKGFFSLKVTLDNGHTVLKKIIKE